MQIGEFWKQIHVLIVSDCEIIDVPEKSGCEISAKSSEMINPLAVDSTFVAGWYDPVSISLRRFVSICI
jgi:hypothetical protein